MPSLRGHPVLVFGIDGADPDVLKEQFELGQLPNLRGLAERGSFGTLETDYGLSPVIWTTIATGRRPRVHGIEGFFAATPSGRAHVSTAVRKVPALWNMLTRANRRTAVIGWWPTWPAEDIDGVIISDRAQMNVPRRVSPESFLPRFLEMADAAHAEVDRAPWNPARGLNRFLVSRAAQELASEAFDLVLVYFRDVDFASHQHWSSYEPEPFGEPPVSDPTVGSIPDAYRGIDVEVGRILERAHPETNVFVISDHGFRAAPDKPTTVSVEMDAVLAFLGYLKPEERSGACPESRARTKATVPASPIKLLELCGGARRGESRALRLRDELGSDLTSITYLDGSPVFELREPTPPETMRGADLVVEVRTQSATQRVLVNGEPNNELVRYVGRVTGDHDADTDGVIIAAGPDVANGGSLEDITIRDVAPTLLYALGLPVAEDFAGRAWVELFDVEFRKGRPLRTIPSWGTREAPGALATDRDDDMTDELESLGYLSREPD